MHHNKISKWEVVAVSEEVEEDVVVVELVAVVVQADNRNNVSIHRNQEAASESIAPSSTRQVRTIRNHKEVEECNSQCQIPALEHLIKEWVDRNRVVRDPQ